MTTTSAGDRNLPASLQDDSLLPHPVSDPGVASLYAEPELDPRLAGIYQTGR